MADAPPELKEILDLNETGPALDKVSFQFRSVGLTRPWLRPEAFRAKFWRLPASEPPLSDGASPPQGTCPAYVTGVVFAREIVEATRQSGGAVDLLPIRALPMMVVRPEMRVQPPAVPLVVGPRPGVRHAAPFAGAMARLGVRMAAPEAVRVAPPAVRPAVRDHRGVIARAGLTRRSFSPLERLSMSTFMIQPARFDATGVPPPAPPAPPPASAPPNVITILAFICKRLPKCPDPDPSLTWTD